MSARFGTITTSTPPARSDAIASRTRPRGSSTCSSTLSKTIASATPPRRIGVEESLADVESARAAEGRACGARFEAGVAISRRRARTPGRGRPSPRPTSTTRSASPGARPRFRTWSQTRLICRWRDLLGHGAGACCDVIEGRARRVRHVQEIAVRTAFDRERRRRGSRSRVPARSRRRRTSGRTAVCGRALTTPLPRRRVRS